MEACTKIDVAALFRSAWFGLLRRITFRLESGGNYEFTSVQMFSISKIACGFILSSVLSLTLVAQIAPNKPIKNFKLPRLGENGYTQWVLQGATGIYDGPEQVRIHDMGLRVYTGDQRMALEMSIASPEATLRIEENKAFSESTIEIVGSNFKITGVGWTWDGETKEIEVLFDTVVQLNQNISDSFSLVDETAPIAAPKTVIHSDRLKLTTTQKEYRFELQNNVHVASSDMDMTSNLLVALLDAPQGREKQESKMKKSELDSVRYIVAQDKVIITQRGRVVRADAAEFFPREKKVNLSGGPRIEVLGAYLSGDTISSQEGGIVILGSKEFGRAQMILTETGGLGIQGGSSLADETIVLADSINMREQEEGNQFFFDGSVEIMSGAVQLRSERMQIFLDNYFSEKPEVVTPNSEVASLKLGKVRKMFADGDVRIEQSGQVATSEQVVFYPDEERAVMSGNPKLTNGEVVVVGEKVELQPKLAIVRGSKERPVNVVLPTMPDLGYEAFYEVATVNSPKPLDTKQKGHPQETIVRSQLLRMLEQADRTVFRFTEDVTVEATNLQANCDRLDVIAKENRTKDTQTSELTDRLEVHRIEASGNVGFVQDLRTATSDKAFMLPLEGKVILEGNAIVNDAQGKVTGHLITLLQGERRAIVEGGGENKQRATITLPTLPTGKF